MIKYIDFYHYVSKYQLGYIEKDVLLKNYTTLKIGGKCLCVYKPNSIKALIKAYKYILRNKLDYFILGNGSNTLISDEYHPLIVINLKKINSFILDFNKLYVEAGMMGNVLSKKISLMNFSGLEFLAGIPGTIGGMIYTNAGAWGTNISDVIESITYLNEFGNLCTMKNLENKGFSYRKSPFMKRHIIILSCEIHLRYNIEADAIYNNYLNKKLLSQPLATHNAGCTFKNPHNLSAWKLIRQYESELKFENVSISDKHANFLINNGSASFNEMLTAINTIKEVVYKKNNIKLELEITILE